MSTMLLIGRTPHARRRRWTHAGLLPTLTPVMTPPMYRLQRSASSIETSTMSRPAGSALPVNAGMKSTFIGLSSPAASSRATPRWPMQSGRLEVTSTSMVAWLGMTVVSGSPGRPESRMRMPEWSSPRRSSSAEQSIPFALKPAMLRSFTTLPLGTVVPGSATATKEPGTALSAPAMICSVRPPRSTWCTHSGLRDFGCFFCSITLPTMISDRSITASDSTSMPTRVSTSAASFGVTPSRSTKSPSHSYEIFHLRLKLFEEAEVGFVEQADVIDVVLEHRDPLDPEAPGIAVPLLGIDAAVAQDLWMDHAAAPDFEPSLVPAALAASARADAAGYVELKAGLGEGEVARADSHLALLAVERLDHVHQRALHVADGQRLVHGQAFDLAEVRQPGGFGRVAAVAAAGVDDVDRRLFDALHGSYLHWRCMRPEQKVRREVERIPVLARRMAGRDVERLDVVPLGLDLRAELDLVAQRFEHCLDLALHLREHVDVAAADRRAWKRDVDRLRFGDLGQPRFLELVPLGRQRRLDRALGLVGRLAESSALLRRQLADVRQQAADAPVLAAEVVDLDRCQPLLRELLWIAHAALLRLISKRMSAAAAATFRDSTPSFSCTVTSLRSRRDSPWASLPSTIMPAFSIGVVARGAPPALAAP